jgi:hypothetical protein
MTFRRFPASTQRWVHTRRYARVRKRGACDAYRWVHMYAYLYASHAPRRACAHGRKEKDAAVGCMKCMYAPCRVRGSTHHTGCVTTQVGVRSRDSRLLGENTQRVHRSVAGTPRLLQTQVRFCHAPRFCVNVKRYAPTNCTHPHQAVPRPDHRPTTARTAAQDQRNRRTGEPYNGYHVRNRPILIKDKNQFVEIQVVGIVCR